jgi:hypothetical protein
MVQDRKVEREQQNAAQIDSLRRGSYLEISMHTLMTLRRRMPAAAVLLGLLLALHSLSSGWGWDTHRFINRKSVYHLPGQMLLFIQDSTIFAQHAADADQRRVSGDTTFFGETPRHFLDIDDYPGFQHLPRALDTLIRLYGWERVKQNGTLPWAIAWTYDSLVQQLERGDWTNAIQSASDLGHYVGDAHQPLHVTRNYNGQLTNNYGIHSRYETMLSPGTYLGSLFITPDSAVYVDVPLDGAFDLLLHSNECVDTILTADTYARAVSGWNGSGQAPAAYYAALWERTRGVTLDQVQRATRMLSDLWYSAWVDAGLLLPAGADMPAADRPAAFLLVRNYPNPFNPTTIIAYDLPVGGTVSLTVCTITGATVRTIAPEHQSAGPQRIAFDGTGLAAGVYFCRVQIGRFAATTKMLLVR